MSFQIGIVGLPNVGKSTLFNAITKSEALAANYPFATIEPNVAVVPVADARLDKLAAQEQSEKIIPTAIEFVDIAGLVRGAHKGEGLGNQFLSHIREVDAILQVVRGFSSSDIIHVSGKIDPKDDMLTIETELELADLANVEKRLEGLQRLVKSGDKEAASKTKLLERYKLWLEEGKPARDMELSDEEIRFAREFQLLTGKPLLMVVNAGYDMSEKKYDFVDADSSFTRAIVLDAKLESELAQLEPEDKKMYLEELALDSSGLDRVVAAAYKTLNLVTFITAGPKETRAWTVEAGTKAPQAAGKIHTDFEKGFIRAEVISTEKLLEAGSYARARELGTLRVEGKEYVIADGDVVHFRFSP